MEKNVYFIFSQTQLQGFLLALSLAVVFIAALFISVVSIYALCALVIDGKGIRSAVVKAWSVFTKHTLVSLEVGILLMFLFRFWTRVVVWLLLVHYIVYKKKK